jgi:hypothetical protein
MPNPRRRVGGSGEGGGILETDAWPGETPRQGFAPLARFANRCRAPSGSGLHLCSGHAKAAHRGSLPDASPMQVPWRTVDGASSVTIVRDPVRSGPVASENRRRELGPGPAVDVRDPWRTPGRVARRGRDPSAPGPSGRSMSRSLALAGLEAPVRPDPWCPLISTAEEAPTGRAQGYPRGPSGRTLDSTLRREPQRGATV